VLAIELPVHQHVIDVDELFSRIEQVLDDLLPTLAFSYRAGIEDEWDSVPDQLDCRPLIGVLVSVLFRSDDLVLMAGAVAREGIGLGDVDGDNTRPEELPCLREFVDKLLDCLSVHLANLLDREITNLVAMTVSEWCSITRRLVDEAPSALVGGQVLTEPQVGL
jgi:hypothetical protein